MNVPLQGLLASLDRAIRLGEIVRFASSPRGLEITAVGADCRIASYCEAEGELPTCYVQAGSLVKALATRPLDRPARLAVSDTTLTVHHAEYRARLPLIDRQTFEMVWAGGERRFVGDDLVAHLDAVSSIVDRNERHGVLFDWHDGSANFVGLVGGRQFHHASWAVEADVGRYCMSRGAADNIVRLGTVVSWWAADGSLYFEAADAFLRVSPMRDSYPRDYLEIVRREPFVLTCAFRREHLDAAVKAADAMLSKNDIDVMLKIAGQADLADQQGCIVEISARNGSTRATTAERIFATCAVVLPWEGRVNCRDLLRSLKHCDDEAVVVDFGKTLVRLRSGALHSYLMLLN